MAKEQLAVMELIWNMIQGKTDHISKVDYFPQKTEAPDPGKSVQYFERATPESQGISSRRLAALIRELGETSSTDMHHLMILRNSKVICECNFAPYRSGIWHITHSMCKSITGMAIGMLIEEGKLSLDENIYKIFESRQPLLLTIFHPTVTVENLLTMTSGVMFNETGAVSGNDWLGSYLNAPVQGKPGTVFQYNSMNTYVLSAIVTERTGLSLLEYLKPRLFEPLGITNICWESCPKGITKGGWGLFICAEDMAKLGQLYLQNGVWEGKQLIPEAWIRVSTEKHYDSEEGTYGYGYQIWQEERPGSFEFNGMLGQNVVVYPDLNMVIVTNAGSDEFFQNCVMLNIMRRHFPCDYMPELRLEENPCDQLILQRLVSQMESGQGEPLRVRHGGWKKRKAESAAHSNTSYLKMLGGKQYDFGKTSVGIFPLITQVFHNNLTDGISRMSFQEEQGSFFLKVQEGESQAVLEIGFGRARESILIMHEEKYRVAVLGEFARDEDHMLVLKLDIAFVEEAVRRKIKIFFHKEQIEVRWQETPGKHLIMQGLSSILDELENKSIFSAISGLRDLQMVRTMMERTIEPVTTGKLVAEEEKQDSESDRGEDYDKVNCHRH
ncbi:MAG: serine hydrolase [Lachnospiraceae bacterium]|nr:serine hydrolase [Lachnospiraceae bacterium]